MSVYHRILFSLVLCSVPKIAMTGPLTLNWSHGPNNALYSTSEYLDYINWEALSTLYKEVHTQPPVNASKASVNQKANETTLALFSLPTIPEARFWFWMSSEEKRKRQKIEAFIDDIKPLLSNQQEDICVKLLKNFIERGRESDLDKVMNIVTSLSSALPSMQRTISELIDKKMRSTSIDFTERTTLEKLLTSEESKSYVQKKEFECITKKIQRSEPLTEKENQKFVEFTKKLPEEEFFKTILSTSNMVLMEGKKYADLVTEMVKNINSEEKIDQLLSHTKFLFLLPKNSFEHLLHQKLEYVRKKFWEEKIAWIGTNFTASVDKEEWIREEAMMVENFKQNAACLSFLIEHFSALKAGNFSQLVSQRVEEKETILISTAQPEPLGKNK